MESKLESYPLSEYTVARFQERKFMARVIKHRLCCYMAFVGIPLCLPRVRPVVSGGEVVPPSYRIVSLLQPQKEREPLA